MKVLEIRQELKAALSPLEAVVLETLAKAQGMKTREVHHLVARKKKVALTSVAVMLDRLYSKGLVDRKVESCRGGYRYIYFAAANTEKFEEKMLGSAVNKLIERFGSVAVSYFNERFGKVK